MVARKPNDFSVSVTLLTLMIKWKSRSYTKEKFTEVWLKSTSISEVAKLLNCNRSGSGFYTLRNAARDLGLTEEHMGKTRTERSLLKRRKNSPLSEILVENSEYTNTNCLKNRLITEGFKTFGCEECKNTIWCGKPIPLALDHINGKRRDNRIENLRILCYNCHGQTPTFGSKNKVNKLLV